MSRGTTATVGGDRPASRPYRHLHLLFARVLGLRRLALDGADGAAGESGGAEDHGEDTAKRRA